MHFSTETRVFGVMGRGQGAEKRGMTPEQMEYRAQQAQDLLERYSELERERETAGLYEEALEARRLRLEQEASVVYWRERLSSAA
jgi:hypothetical protein